MTRKKNYMEKIARRKFIKTTAALGALTLLNRNSLFARDAARHLKHFGLQLYTLRDVFGNDPAGYIRQVGEMGYREIESYEGKEGMFWGMEPQEFKKCINDAGMQLISSHCDITQDFEQKVIQAASIGMEYLICAWVGPQKTLDAYKKIADDFNVKGALCKKHGIKFAYHNHAYSFKETEGQVPQDVMMQITDPALVDYEMDFYWVITAGADPIHYLEKYKGRFTLGHLKDRKKNAAPEDTDASCTLGQGSIDFSKIIPVARKNGMQHFFLEQERYDGTTPIQCVEDSARYLKKLKI